MTFETASHIPCISVKMGLSSINGEEKKMISKNETSQQTALPQIDLMVPAELQTATFAYG